MSRRIPAEAYGRDFFLGPFLEGYSEFQEGRLSVVKARQLEMLELEGGVSVLEVGYGRGELLLHCARMGASVAGIDYAPEAFKIARVTMREFPRADLRLGDCTGLPFEDDSFDRVFSGDVIEHLSFNDAVLKLKEMYRVTRPGGFILVHTTPNTLFTRYMYPWARHVLRFINERSVEEIDAHLKVMKRLHVDEYNLFTLRRAARRAGLPGARVWVDEDLLRSSKHRHTQVFAANRLARFVGSLGKYSAVRLLLGNDLYLKCVK
ncbi:MAG TPA: class I SAM-dependent methyltransferase [Blastocatellia bacterium]|jgi:ubiquinone/menaquinone biosynthesis C-methylase UbiE